VQEEAIRTKIKEIISKTTSIDMGDIGDQASFQEDLELDSLTLLEIAVDVDHLFKLNLSDDDLSAKLAELRTLQDAVELVQQHMAPQMAEV
jgi:acyl carrier protein